MGYGSRCPRDRELAPSGIVKPLTKAGLKLPDSMLLEALGDRGHDPGCEAHHAPHRRRQVGSAEFARGRAVCRFIGPHTVHDCPAGKVGLRQSVEVAREVIFHLLLCLDNKTQAGWPAHDAGRCPERETSRVPQRVEDARAPTKLLHALGTPRQMILLLVGGRQELVADCRIAGAERLAAVQSLGCDLTGVIHAHERGAGCAVAV